MATYNRLNPEDTAVSTDKVVSNTWSDNTNILQHHFTSSTQTAISTATSQGNFFIEVFTSSSNQGVKPIEGEGPVQYTLSYGHKAGSGSLNFTSTAGALGNTATKVIYNQYRQLVFGDETSNFTFNGFESNDIWVINVARGRYKHALKARSLNLKLNDGSNTLHLTDDSVTTSGSATVTNLGRQFNLVSGSSGVRSGSTTVQTVSGSYGFFYPDSGFIILNPRALSMSIAISESVGANENNHNHHLFKNAISGGNSFIVDSEEKVTSQYFFTRAKNNEFNYTTNPSFIDTNGNLNFTSMVDNPKTFITTIGLYNDSNDLVAVAKVSQPISKDFSKEALMRVKLDY